MTSTGNCRHEHEGPRISMLFPQHMVRWLHPKSLSWKGRSNCQGSHGTIPMSITRKPRQTASARYRLHLYLTLSSRPTRLINMKPQLQMQTDFKCGRLIC